MIIPEGSMRKRREAMAAMVKAGKAMLKAQAECGVLDLPEKCNLVAIQVQDFIQWRQSMLLKPEPKPDDKFI